MRSLKIQQALLFEIKPTWNQQLQLHKASSTTPKTPAEAWTEHLHWPRLGPIPDKPKPKKRKLPSAISSLTWQELTKEEVNEKEAQEEKKGIKREERKLEKERI